MNAPDTTGPVVLFDGECNVCNASVQFIIARDPRQRFRFASLQSPVAKALCARAGLDPAALDTVILIESGRAWVRSSAALEITRRLQTPWPLLYGFVIVPRSLRDWAYSVFARHRYRLFGKRDHCLMPSPALRARFLDG